MRVGKIVGTEIWPIGIALALQKVSQPTDFEFVEPLSEGVKDVTLDSLKVCRDFAPDVRALGFGPWRDKSGRSWGGLLFRALQSKDKKEMCLQYVYSVTRQIGVISSFWNIILPILMLGWALAIHSFYCPLSQLAGNEWMPTCPWFALICIMSVSGPLFLLGIGPHLRDLMRLPIGLRINLRPTSLLPVYSLLTLLVPFIGFLIIYPFFATIATHMLYYYFQNQKKTPFRVLDYIPIFVWLHRDSTDEQWKFHRAGWQFKYQRSLMTEKSEKIEHSLRDGRRLILITDSGWDSMYRGSVIRSLMTKLSLLIALVSFAGFIIFIATGLFASSLVYLFSTLIILPFLFVVTGQQIARWPLALLDFMEMSQDLDKEMHLNDAKLKVLWNLPEEARLKIRAKLQNPFIDDDLFLLTYRDSLARLVVDTLNYPEEGWIRVVAYGYDTQIHFRFIDGEFDVYEKEYIVPTSCILELKGIKNPEEGDVFETYDATSLTRYLELNSDEWKTSDGDLNEIESLKSDIRLRKIVKEIQSQFNEYKHYLESELTFKKPDKELWKVEEEKFESPDISSHFQPSQIIEKGLVDDESDEEGEL